MTGDVGSVFQWWLVLFVIGGVFFPFSSLIFSQFTDRGYLFSKVLGMIFISYLVFVLGAAHIFPFSTFSTVGAVVLFLLANLFIIYLRKGRSFFSKFTLSVRGASWKLIFFEEVFFFLAILFWAYIRGHEPSINGLEKFMDFGFVNSILRSEYFPPRDMWYTPEPINYYYFGHLVTAVLTRLSFLSSSVTYNLMIATLFAFTLIGSFSIGFHFFKRARLGMVAGILSGALVAFSGNLHILYSFFGTYKTDAPVPFWQLPLLFSSFPNGYWYPNATRFIVNTIHEFPIYSFVVSDLHGHVLSIPFVLLTLATLLSVYLAKKFTVYTALFLSFLVSVLYMTNAMDGVIYLLLCVFVIFLFSIQKLDVRHGKRVRHYFVFQTYISRVAHVKEALRSFVFYVAILFLGYVVFSFPFNAFFDPFVSGVGVLCAPQFLVDIGKIGPLLFEADHCQRSPWWQLLTLYGFFIFFSTSLFIFYARSKKYVLDRADHFVILLILFSFLLLLIPEFVYAKDIYPDHYRANTMFKLAYQAFMMLSLTSAYSAVRILSFTKSKIFFLVAFLFISPVILYSYFATTSYYGNLQLYRGIDGTAYMKGRLPDDYATIQYINQRVTRQPVLVEAQGDSYTDYQRISANTGVVNVLGWTVHEWLWRGTYDVVAPRISEVQQIYESKTLEGIIPLLEKYDVEYIYFGNLEREKYPNINEEKFASSGKFELVFESGESRLYRRTRE